MATSRYRRVNLDGKSVTETRTMKANGTPGVFVTIDGGLFTNAIATSGRIYVLHPANHQGLGIRDDIPADDSAVAEYVEEGRELAVLVGAGTYKKDDPIKFNASGTGRGELASDATDRVVGYCQDEVTLTGEDFIRVRFRAGIPATA